MLGRARLEHLLHDVMGYDALRVNPLAYTAGLQFDDAVEMCARLMRFARQRGRHFGCKFCNTLEVLNTRQFFAADNKTMYLSGQPLHVLALTLVDEFRRRVGSDVPISFSAGIDRHNFPLAVACGFAPVTVVTDLLRPGGYGRLPAYLASLTHEMADCGAANLDEYILNRFGQQDEARRRAKTGPAAVRWAGLLNTSIVAEMARDDPRYRADKNNHTPNRIDSRLTILDCLACNKCLPVCPNAALFAYPTPPTAFDYRDIIVAPDGTWRAGPQRRFEITKPTQIACFADFCNECGNCGTFCPEVGEPYKSKPNFFTSEQAWQQAAPRDAFVVRQTDQGSGILARLNGRTAQLVTDAARGISTFSDDVVALVVSPADHTIKDVARLTRLPDEDHHVDFGMYHLLRHICAGVLDPERVNQVNVASSEPQP